MSSAPPSLEGRDAGLALLLAAAGAIYYGAYAGAFPFLFGDEGYLLYLAAAVGRGEVPFLDFQLFNYPPGLFYLFAPWVEPPSTALASARRLMAVGLVVRALLTFLCVRLLAGRGAAVTAAGVVLLVPGPWHKFYVGGLSMAVLAAVLLHLRHPSPGRAAGVGGALGVSALIRLDVAAAGSLLFAVTSAWTLVRGRAGGTRAALSHLAATGGVAVACWTPLAVTLAGQGVLHHHLDQWTGLLARGARRLGGGVGMTVPGWEELAAGGRGTAEAVVFWGLAAGLALCLPLAARGSLAAATAPPEARRLSSWVVAAWALAALPPILERPDVAHVTQYAPPLVVAIAGTLDSLRRRPRRPWGRHAVTTAGLFLAVAFVGKHLAFAEGGSAGVLASPASRVELSNGFRYPSRPSELERSVLEELLAAAPAEEAIGCLPYDPGIAFAAGRRLATRDIFLAPHSLEGDPLAAGFLTRWRAARPRLVTYRSGMSFSRGADGRLSAWAPAVHRHLEGAYTVRRRSGSLLLLELTGREPPTPAAPRPDPPGPARPAAGRRGRAAGPRRGRPAPRHRPAASPARRRRSLRAPSSPAPPGRCATEAGPGDRSSAAGWDTAPAGRGGDPPPAAATSRRRRRPAAGR